MEPIAVRPKVLAFAIFLMVAAIIGFGIYGLSQINKAQSARFDRFQFDAVNTTYQNQLQACFRGDDIRRELNARRKEHDKQKFVSNIILEAASSARLSSYQRNHNAEDLKAYKSYQKALVINNSIHFNREHTVDCKETVHKPAILNGSK